MQPVKMKLLSQVDMENIHTYALEILKKNGITFRGRALDILKHHGFRTDGQQVYFTKEQVENALSTCPKSFVLRGRDSKFDLELGLGKDMGVPGPVGPVNVTDIHGKLRPGTLEDISNLSKIYQASSVINMNSNTSVEANDIPVEDRHLRVQMEVLRHCSKPYYTKILGYEAVNQVMDMTELALGGYGALKNGVYMAIGSAPALSPMGWDDTTTDCIIACAERGQLVTLGTGSITGVTSPIQIMGTLVMQNAELLSGIVLTQLVNPGNPVGYGTGTMPGNMQGAKYNCGSPSRMFIMIGTVEMGKEFYHLPSRTLTYGTESHLVDYQTAIESYEGTVGGILSGADYMLSEIGTLSGLMTVSYEKTILDEEMTGRILHLRKGMDTSPETCALDTILKVGSGGSFLLTSDTLFNCRSDWYPSCSQWGKPMAEDGETNYELVLQKAYDEWNRRVAEAPKTTLSPDVERDLSNYLSKHCIHL